MSRFRRALLLALFILCAPQHANAARPRVWLRDHLIAEWLVAAGGWRTGIGSDVRAPAFDVLAGGSVLTLGLEVGRQMGFLVEGRFLAGEHAGGLYYEGLSGIGFYARIGSRFRLGVGPEAGALRAPSESATMVGGFLLGSFDLFELRGRLAVALGVQLDVDAMLNVSPQIPQSTLALTAGVGVRY